MLRWLLLLPLLLAGVIIGLSIYLQPNNFMSCGSTPGDASACETADAIVVVSGGDTAARAAAGIKLYLNGWADYLVLSGAALDKTGPSNAAAMKAQAQAAGVPEAAIIIDEDAVNTKENAANVQSIFKAHNFHDVILVTSGYHQRRASLEFNKLAGDTVIRNYPIADKDWGWYWWMTPRGWWLAGGETVKIIAFYLGATS